MSLFFELALFEVFPLLLGLSGEVARQGFDGDTVFGAELTPQQKARVVLPRLVGNFIGQSRLLLLFILAQLNCPHS